MRAALALLSAFILSAGCLSPGSGTQATTTSTTLDAGVECRVPADCQGRPHIMCAGSWSCTEGECSWDCEVATQKPEVEVE